MSMEGYFVRGEKNEMRWWYLPLGALVLVGLMVGPWWWFLTVPPTIALSDWIEQKLDAAKETPDVSV